MFVQVESTLENPRGGMGIGLALSKLLVEMHDGAIEARSAGPGRGTEIVVRLPLAPIAEAAAASSEMSIVAHDDAGTGPMPARRILVVDDVEASANTLGAALRAMGHDVVVAFDGPSALDAAKRFRPEAVFLDLAMPGMSGYDVAQRLRAMGEASETLLVALTGFAQEEDYRRTRAAGFDHHLVKPASMQRIEALLRDATLPTA
jgi:two-component system CheB/CheR fusion protein